MTRAGLFSLIAGTVLALAGWFSLRQALAFGEYPAETTWSAVNSGSVTRGWVRIMGGRISLPSAIVETQSNLPTRAWAPVTNAFAPGDKTTNLYVVMDDNATKRLLGDMDEQEKYHHENLRSWASAHQSELYQNRPVVGLLHPRAGAPADVASRLAEDGHDADQILVLDEGWAPSPRLANAEMSLGLVAAIAGAGMLLASLRPRPARG